jgi:hypothetical protein
LHGDRITRPDDDRADAHRSSGVSGNCHRGLDTSGRVDWRRVGRVFESRLCAIPVGLEDSSDRTDLPRYFSSQRRVSSPSPRLALENSTGETVASLPITLPRNALARTPRCEARNGSQKGGALSCARHRGP